MAMLGGALQFSCQQELRHPRVEDPKFPNSKAIALPALLLSAKASPSSKQRLLEFSFLSSAQQKEANLSPAGLSMQRCGPIEGQSQQAGQCETYTKARTVHYGHNCE